MRKVLISTIFVLLLVSVSFAQLSKPPIPVFASCTDNPLNVASVNVRAVGRNNCQAFVSNVQLVPK